LGIQALASVDEVVIVGWGWEANEFLQDVDGEAVAEGVHGGGTVPVQLCH
jgi:hypothetical protein